VLLEFRRGVPAAREHAIERSVGGRDVTSLNPWRSGASARVPLSMRVPAGDVRHAVASLRRESVVLHAEPDWLMRAAATPNDPGFPSQWGERNIGQVVPIQNSREELEPGASGTPGDDANVEKAWDVTTGSPSIVVGEVDVGVDYEHPDLAGNIWTNPGGVLGCGPGTRGYNVLEEENRCNPMDTESGSTGYGGHGTHVAGIIGALGNNGLGVAGMNWHTTILPVKWLASAEASSGVEYLIHALDAMVQASKEGVNIRVVNDSAVFKEPTEPPSMLREVIEELGARNILFVTAAGNSGRDIEEAGEVRYPCAYENLPNLVCVTASNDNDELPPFASWGVKKVNLAAPGESIYSTLHYGPEGAQYGYLSGTSMATAQVSGAAALVLSSVPTMEAPQLKADILEHVTKVPTLAGKVSSGGILNVCDAIPLCLNPPPPPPPPPPQTTTTSTSPAPSPPSPPPPAVEVQVAAVTLARTTVTASRHGTITLRLRCAGTASRCAGPITLRLPGVHVSRRWHGRIVHSMLTLTVARGSFSIVRGATGVLTLRLSAAARAQLAGGHTLRLRTTIAAHGTDGSVRTTVVTVGVRPAKRR
jgi:subtilisin family serine protease